MNKKFYSILVIAVFMLGTVGNSTASSDFSLSYTILQTNTTANTWFSSDYSESFKYVLSVGETIGVNSSDVGIDISLGNLTRTGIPDSEAENALAFGYWKLPNTFGFVANTSWDKVTTDFNEISFNESSVKDVELEYLGGAVSAIEFYLFDGFQRTTLIYDKQDGLLLFANSTFLGYNLAIEIAKINGDAEYYKASEVSSTTEETSESDDTGVETEETPVNILPLIIILPLFAYYRRKN